MATVYYLVRRFVALPIAVCLLLAPLLAQESGDAARSDVSSGFGYKFENKRFPIPLIEIDLAPDGTGELRFKRGESDEIIDLKVKLLPETVTRIRGLYDRTSFLVSSEDYQAKKDFSHLGWMTIREGNGKRERQVRFNYTTNELMKELADLFRSIATQEIHLFDIDTAQQYQPLDLPRQLDWLESDLRLGNIAEPERLVRVLGEIAGVDSLPLIARNQANRIITSIKKGKYKSTSKR
jgi:hypothetical protein